jgi:hypothetical protein
MEVHEACEYQVTKYNPQTDDGGLFVHYINTFLKLKAEANGYSNFVQRHEDEDQYISEFHKSEGIQMDKVPIAPNPAKRGLAKLCRLSMCGKLTERNNRTRTKMITDPQGLYRFRATSGIDVEALVFASDDVVCTSWLYIAEEIVHNLRHTNEVTGAYVTPLSRIHLYKYLDGLRQRGLYCDRDCVIYIQPYDHPSIIETGDCLGAMTSELRH